MAAKDKCPSCHQPVSPGDFLCPNCELILDPSLAPARPSGEEVSVVRRLLEIPQRGLPTAKPSTPPRPGNQKRANAGAEGPTRIASLPPERPGVPIVVASLDRVSRELTEFDAWVVSLIDGASDLPALAKKAGLRELELRVVLETLHDRMVVDFADEPLPDEPLFEAELASPDIDGDEPLANEDEPGPGMVVRGTVTQEIPGGSQELLRTPTVEVPRAPAGRGAAHGPPTDAFGEALAEVTGAQPAFVPGRMLDDEPPAAAPRPPSGQRPAVAHAETHAPRPPSGQRPAVARTEPPPPPPPSPAPAQRSGQRQAVEPAQPPGQIPAPRVQGGHRSGVEHTEPPSSPPQAPAPRAQSNQRAAVPRAEPPPPPSPSPAPPPPRPATTPSGGVRAAGAPLAYPADRAGAPRVNGTVQPASFTPTPAPANASPAPRGPERTDPRIAYTGPANRKVLDALKKVKRRDESSPPSAGSPKAPPESPEPAKAAPVKQSPTSAEADARAASALQIALRMEQGGRFEEAVRYLEKSISQSPDAPSLYNRLAIILMRERADLRRAEQCLQKAVDLAPDNDVYAKNLAQIIAQRALRSKR